MTYQKTKAMELRKDARRRALLEAATRLFSRSGYHAATVPKIVAEANSSVGCFYNYFRNKEGIFASILESLGEQLVAVIHEAKESQVDPSLQLQSAIEAAIVFLAQNPQEARILIVESSGLSHRLVQVRRATLWKLADECCSILVGCPEEFPTSSPIVSARCLVGSVAAALSCWFEDSPNDRISPTELSRAVVNFNCRALSQ